MADIGDVRLFWPTPDHPEGTLREMTRRHIDLEPDDGLGPALRDESGRMSENTRLVRRVLLLERAIKEAKAALDKSNNWGEHEARAYRILDALPIPER